MTVHSDRLQALRAQLAAQGLHGFVVPLTDEERAAKRRAVACFTSQVSAPPGRSAVLPPAVVERLVTDRETLFLSHDPRPEAP